MPGAVRDSGHRLLVRLRGGKQAQQSRARHRELWDSQVGKGQSSQREIFEESNVNLKEIIELIQSWRDGGQHDAVDGVGEQLGERLLLGAVAY